MPTVTQWPQSMHTWITWCQRWFYTNRPGGYSLFTLRNARSPLKITGEQAFLRVNRLYLLKLSSISMKQTSFQAMFFAELMGLWVIITYHILPNKCACLYKHAPWLLTCPAHISEMTKSISMKIISTRCRCIQELILAVPLKSAKIKGSFFCLCAQSVYSAKYGTCSLW